jgi:hypothetical protein
MRYGTGVVNQWFEIFTLEFGGRSSERDPDLLQTIWPKESVQGFEYSPFQAKSGC